MTNTQDQEIKKSLFYVKGICEKLGGVSHKIRSTFYTKNTLCKIAS